MEQSPIRFSLQHGVARIVFANPANRNAVDRRFVAALAEATQICAQDEGIRVITITAEGPAFSVGADLDALFRDPEGPEGFVRFLAYEFHASMLRLRNAPAPVVMGVQGIAAGGGFGLVCSADIAVMARSAMLTSAYTASGLMPDAGATWFAPRLLSWPRAFDILATNKRLSAEEAYAAGLVSRIADDEALASTIQEIVDNLLKQPEGTAMRLKKLLSESARSELAEQLDREAEAIALSVTNPEVLACLRRFVK